MDRFFYLTIQNRTKASVETAGPSMKEKIKSMFSREKPVKDSLIKFGLSEEDAENYHREFAKKSAARHRRTASRYRINNAFTAAPSAPGNVVFPSADNGTIS